MLLILDYNEQKENMTNFKKSVPDFMPGTDFTFTVLRAALLPALLR